MKILPTNGAEMPALGLGTWQLKDDTCIDIVSRALDVGYRHVDTAHMYGNEREVGQGIRAASVPREDIFLTTKVWPTDIGAGDLQRSAETSLSALGTDYVDLLLIHWPNKAIPLADSIAALNEVHARGLARNIGVSNFTSAMLEEAASLSETPLACNQVEYHPYLSQKAVHDTAAKLGMAVIAYCPIYKAGALFDEKAVQDAAAAHGKTAAQVVLRWHMQQDGCGAIPRTSRPERLAENFDIFDFELTDSEMSALTALGGRNQRLVNLSGFAPEWDAS
ncbi:MAG: 2,5-didehydrogluconate reductase [Ahrensia sp.]|nr:2,5-didehydrogluconate reductase [Ahrensia sp.]